MTKPKPMSVERLKSMNWVRKLEWAINYESTKPNSRIPMELEGALQGQALRWPSCAVGKLCKKLPREPGSPELPKDAVLKDWGGSFYHAVNCREYKMALRIYHKIEKRTEMLWKKMQEKKK